MVAHRFLSMDYPPASVPPVAHRPFHRLIARYSLTVHVEMHTIRRIKASTQHAREPAATGCRTSKETKNLR